MSEELTKLQGLGAQKIYEDTHIPILHVQALLHHSFDGLSRVQFLGFVSILEREYLVNLSDLKGLGVAFFDEQETSNIDESLFVAPAKKTKKTLYVFSFFAIVAAILIYQFEIFSDNTPTEQIVDNTLIKTVQKTIIPPKEVLVESNTTQELNTTQETNTTLIAKQEPQVKKSFKIIAKSKVWLGYIDVASNKKHQNIFTGEMELDPQKEWLLLFGHSYIDMYVNTKIIKFNSRTKKRFLYKDGNITAISTQEFKKLNRGRKW